MPLTSFFYAKPKNNQCVDNFYTYSCQCIDNLQIFLKCYSAFECEFLSLKQMLFLPIINI
jgi:hypothetical protein